MAESAFSVRDENRFWLKLMSDKAMIVFNSLSPDSPETGPTKGFYDIFEKLYARLLENPTAEQLPQFYRDAETATRAFRALMLDLLRKQLTLEFYMNVKPSFTNHVVSLADQYIYLLRLFSQNKKPDYNPIIQDIFWLPTFQVDARLIADNVEFFDEDVRSEALEYEENFSRLYEFAILLQGFLRTDVPDFPIARQYRKKITELLNKFAVFVVSLLTQAHANMLPGTLTLLELDCIYRITCYYTTQLAFQADAARPACDPGSPELF